MKHHSLLTLLLAALLPAAGINLPGAEDILVADFESAAYRDWQATGEAFGPGPAAGTLPGQMEVSGFAGERLVNSFFQGDGTTGTLTSPPVRLERDYVHFLIGGGGYPGQTCLNLVLDGEVVRSSEGPNTAPGGSEALVPAFWDVRDLKGRTVTFQVVDTATGGWGHINVDQIVLTDTRPDLPEFKARTFDFTISQRYLLIPIQNGARQTELRVEVEGRPVRRYHVELATDAERVDWYAYFTLDAHAGRPARVQAARASEEGFALVRPADRVPGSETWYSEALRPQFHFSQAVGWNNDPNGMVYLDGEWHLFFQHNPVGWGWGNMTWGHAISRDLVHWEQQPNKLFPKTMAVGDCFSGGATIDHQNTAGWKTGENDVLVAFLTDTGAGESVVYSNDRGRTFTWYAGNPVVKHRGRDPKVIWYAYGEGEAPLTATAGRLGGHWVMVVYDEQEPYGRNAAFYTSTNLRDWTEQSHLPGYFECTELFRLPVDGDPGRARWVVFAADAQYAIGDFDGQTFVPEHPGKHQVHWGRYYASQTFDHAPGGRRIQMGWVQVAAPGMPFNQTFSFPHELTLRTTAEGVRMFATPVPEIELLHRASHRVVNRDLADTPVSIGVGGELFDIRATFAPGEAREVGLDIGGNRIVYDAVDRRLGPAGLVPVDGQITVQVLVDRSTLETCGNGGRVYLTEAREHRGPVSAITAFAHGGRARLLSLEVHELNSIWNR